MFFNDMKTVGIKNYNIETLLASGDKAKDFELFRFEYFSRDIEHLKKSHRHNFHAFIFFTKGTGSHIIDFEEYEIIPNRCFFISTGQIHSWTKLNNTKGFIILFTDDFYNHIYTGNELIKSDTMQLNLSSYVDIPNKELQSIEALLKLMESEYLDNKLAWQTTSCLLVKVLVVKLATIRKWGSKIDVKDSRKSQLVYRYQELINTHFKRLKTPKDYAEKLSLTPNYLNSICKEASGKSAGELIKDRIILEAKRLILHSNLTIAEIGYSLGFEDKSHFGKYFRNSIGMAPDKFRKQIIVNK
jgi:AraC-like DNA-binding protein/mannose-6-phosphate isomerase-like protein (cupin superfamily)